MQDIAQLRNALSEIDRIADSTWKVNLNSRKLAELQFHDAHRDRQQQASVDQDTYERFYGNKKYYSATDQSRTYVSDWIQREAKGRVFLDYACGDGGNAIEAARAGAK